MYRLGGEGVDRPFWRLYVEWNKEDYRIRGMVYEYSCLSIYYQSYVTVNSMLGRSGEVRGDILLDGRRDDRDDRNMREEKDVARCRPLV